MDGKLYLESTSFLEFLEITLTLEGRSRSQEDVPVSEETIYR